MAEDDDFEDIEADQEPGVFADADLAGSDDETEMYQGVAEEARAGEMPPLQTFLPTPLRRTDPVIVPPNQRRTTPVMSPAELSRLSGFRARHIQEGRPLRIPLEEARRIINPVEIAMLELQRRLLPEYKIERQIGNRIEIWSSSELSIPGASRQLTSVHSLVSRNF